MIMISLRALEPIDVDTLYRWENDPAVWGVGATLAPFSRKQLWDYINSYDGDIYSARQLRLMVVFHPEDGTPDVSDAAEPQGGVTVGTVDLYDFDPANSRCGVGILIAPEYRRRGFASETLREIAEYCRERLSLHQVYAITSIENIASRDLFLSQGYKISGRLRSWLCHGGRYTDAFLLQRLL